MKKRILIILFFLTFIYICWPLINIYKFYVAVKRYDIEFFEKNINWKTLRAGFKKDLEIIIDEKSLYINKYSEAKINFITNQKISGNLN